RADRRAVDLAVGDVGPRLAAVGGLPKAAASLARVANLRLALHAADRDRSAGVVGADTPPAKPLGYHGVEGERGCRSRGYARQRLGTRAELNKRGNSSDGEG